MAVGERQKLIVNIVSEVLECEPTINIRFDWFINKYKPENFKQYYTYIDNIFTSLGGERSKNQSKRLQYLKCDAYFDKPYNFMFEFDEFQHFSSHKFKALSLYPQAIELGFDLDRYKQYCLNHMDRADKYRKNKQAVDFPFVSGRTAQRAYLDAFRDILPTMHDLKKTIRISEFEVVNVHEKNAEGKRIVKNILKKYI